MAGKLGARGNSTGPAALSSAERLVEQARGLAAAGQSDAALAVLETAAILDPRLPAVPAARATIYRGIGNRRAAAESYRAAAALAPGSENGRLSAARAFIEEDDLAAAERSLRQTLTRFPRNPHALALLGILFADLGRFDESRTWLERAVTHGGSFAALWYDLVRARRLTEADRPMLARMAKVLADPALGSRPRVAVHLARGKLLDDLDDPDAALAEWLEAARIGEAALPYARDVVDRQTDATIAAFPAGTPRAPPASQSDLPILIVGLPRSGTTLTEQVLSGHPEIVGGGERSDWPRLCERRPVRPDPLALAALGAQLNAEWLAALGELAGPGIRRVTDKLPQNYLWLGLIDQLYPNARIIHCRRTAIDTALSIMATFFGRQATFPAMPADILHYVAAYERLMAHWRRVLRPDRFLEIDYEALTADPEPVVRRMLDFAGVDWDPACIAPQDNRRIVRTASKWQARQPVNTASVARWRRYEPWLGDLAALVPRP